MRTKQKIEYGDFQTPLSLARKACSLIKTKSIIPSSIIEPSCGIGNFLIAASETFPTATVLGLEMNFDYVAQARKEIERSGLWEKVQILQGDFFKTDWISILRKQPGPILILGNPPWVTNTSLEILGSSNLPKKSNFLSYSGFEAISGKSNFDISEWMLLLFLELLQGQEATVAMLCKTSVARKITLFAAKKNLYFNTASIYRINAQDHFDAAVDACLFLFKTDPHTPCYDVQYFNSFEDHSSDRLIGFRNGIMVSDIAAYNKVKDLHGVSHLIWRSGIKHDCSKILEFTKPSRFYKNGLNEIVDLENTYLFPLLKSSDLANGKIEFTHRWILVPQKFVGENTESIQINAPLTWEYLRQHKTFFEKRGSSIYKKQPLFSIFGIGDYSFSDWKVGISGLYKKIKFRVIGPQQGKPVMLDDTCYFLPCSSEDEAIGWELLLNSTVAHDFLNSLIFWDAKRPITKEILQQIDLRHLVDSCEKQMDFSKNPNCIFPRKRIDLSSHRCNTGNQDTLFSLCD